MNTRRRMLTALCTGAGLAVAATSIASPEQKAQGPANEVVTLGSNVALPGATGGTPIAGATVADPMTQRTMTLRPGERGDSGHPKFAQRRNTYEGKSFLGADQNALRNVGPDTYCQPGYRDDLNPPGSRNAATASVVDNFKSNSAHLIGTAITVRWAGMFRRGGGTPASPWLDATPAQYGVNGTASSLGDGTNPLPQTFNLILHNQDGTGKPLATPVHSTSAVSATRVLDTANGGTGEAPPGHLSIPGYVAADGSFGPDQDFQVWTYSATLTTQAPLVAGTCYWLQVRHTSTLPAGVGWRWMYSVENAADNYTYQKFDASPDFGLLNGNFDFDMAWCISIAASNPASTTPFAACPALSAPPDCPYPSYEPPPLGPNPNTNCQRGSLTPDGTLIGSNSNEAATFITMDNFVTTAPNTVLQGLCFTGFHGGGGTDPELDTAFRIRIWKNNDTSNPGDPYSYPDETMELAEYVVKPAGSTNVVTATANTSIALNQAPHLGFGGLFMYVVDLDTTGNGGITIPTAGCWWVSAQALNANNAWFWIQRQFTGTPSAINGDNLTAGFGPGYVDGTSDFTVLSQSYNVDYDFCLSFALNGNQLTVCPPLPVAANGSCATAATLPNTQAPDLEQTLNTGNNGAVDGNGEVMIPGFNSVVDEQQSPAVWYKMTGNGQRYTVTTCAGGSPSGGEPADTNFNTLIIVYCHSGGCTGTFKAVAENDNDLLDADNDGVPDNCAINTANADSAVGVGASTVSWNTVNGQEYYLIISGTNGLVGQQGFFWLSTSTAAPDADDETAACSAIQDAPCTITIPPEDANNIVETGLCLDENTNPDDQNDDACATTDNDTRDIDLGDWAHGTVFTTGFGTDQDWWHLPDQTGDTVYRLQFFSEAPMDIVMFQDTCPFQDELTGVGVGMFPCYPGGSIEIALAQGGGGGLGNGVYVVVRSSNADGGGLPCRADGRNKYRFRVTIAPTGACCRPLSPQCTITSRENCTFGQSEDGTVVGAYAGDGSVCNPNPDPCQDGTPYTTAAFGACCSNDGTCTVTTSAGCPTGPGTSWTVAADQNDTTTACTDTSCDALNYRACCFTTGVNQGTCQVLAQAYCATISGATSQVGSCLPLTCVFVTNQACCTQGVCTVVDPGVCTSGGGTPQGPAQTTCVGVNCPKGICCYGATCRNTFAVNECTTAFLDPGNLERAGAKFIFPGGACNLLGPPVDAGPRNYKVPCCKSDYNQNGGPATVQDLFDFLADWFAKKIGADINNAIPAAGATVTVQDLFDFLTAWFAKGC